MQATGQERKRKHTPGSLEVSQVGIAAAITAVFVVGAEPLFFFCMQEARFQIADFLCIEKSRARDP